MSKMSAPESVQVVRRDIRFDLDSADLRSWHPDGLHVAHFFNALSVFFPEGEKFFIDSVRHYGDQIDSPALLADVVAHRTELRQHVFSDRSFFEIEPIRQPLMM